MLSAACDPLIGRPDHVTFDSAASDDLLTPGADEDLTSPLPGQERQALLNSQPSETLVLPPYLRYDVPGYTPTADTISQSSGNNLTL